VLSISVHHSFVSMKPTTFALLALCSLTFSAISLELNDELITFIQGRFGSEAVERLNQWEKLANTKDNLDDLDKLKQVNTFFNQAEFISDIKHWGKEDYWATPLELLATNGGDCEDYSIAKYFTLREMGVAMDKIKITYVKAVKLNQAHMVLAYYDQPGAEPLILDNLIDEIKPASQRNDLIPVYSFNGEGLWLSKLRGQEGKRIGDADKLKSWQDLLTRQHNLMK
jgi:predicted transglutaminase-like cysteine proteinase